MYNTLYYYRLTADKKPSVSVDFGKCNMGRFIILVLVWSCYMGSKPELLPLVMTFFVTLGQQTTLLFRFQVENWHFKMHFFMGTLKVLRVQKGVFLVQGCLASDNFRSQGFQNGKIHSLVWPVAYRLGGSPQHDVGGKPTGLFFSFWIEDIKIKKKNPHFLYWTGPNFPQSQAKVCLILLCS